MLENSLKFIDIKHKKRLLHIGASASPGATQISCASCFHASSLNKPCPLLKNPEAATTVRALLANSKLRFQLGFTSGNLLGMYLAQHDDIPNLADKPEEIKKDLEAKKKPHSS
ncbi:uncharacterized protein LOC117016675 [Rhinolophus ferrumequinum]|uniref:uncharacterized protein LOC117016675 n=1 Tax=Rhinolophus ferrumequinum TaxID=59479 RepID=UPI00140FCA85|nr:uncharacterized protein LOC117016675 [Rhinolophus ferrumequinum]